MQHIANRDQRDILLEFLRRGLTFEWADTIAMQLRRCSK
uniref:Uncharacterized protein n=1 Tax=Tetraselmis sp. GSL018 TaxID=582737 RepID=A0A061SND5_9CHLO